MEEVYILDFFLVGVLGVALGLALGFLSSEVPSSTFVEDGTSFTNVDEVPLQISAYREHQFRRIGSDASLVKLM
jgi:hypothetical protein